MLTITRSAGGFPRPSGPGPAPPLAWWQPPLAKGANDRFVSGVESFVGSPFSFVAAKGRDVISYIDWLLFVVLVQLKAFGSARRQVLLGKRWLSLRAFVRRRQALLERLRMSQQWQ